MIAVWQDTFLPKLTRLGGERRSLLPRPVRAAMLFFFFLFVAFVVYLIVTGQLSNFIEFQ